MQADSHPIFFLIATNERNSEAGPFAQNLGVASFGRWRLCASWEELFFPLSGHWREHLMKKRCFSAASQTTGTKEKRK